MHLLQRLPCICRRPRIVHMCSPWEEAPWLQAMPNLAELVVDVPGAACLTRHST